MENISEGQSPPEQQQVDFKAIFDRRLKDVGLTPEDDLRFDGYENAAIGEIKKEIPAMIIRGGHEGEWNLWITDPIL